VNKAAMSEWKTYKLGDVADIIMGQSPSGETCNSEGSGIPLLNGPTEFGTFFPTPVQFTTDPKKMSEIDDILFCVRGSTTGRMNWSNKKYAIGRGLAAIRHKKGKEYKYFLKGLIDFNLNKLLGNATGSTFPKMTLRLFTTWRSRCIQPRFLGERPSKYPFSFASLS
jgi:type I restriction enzyme S subunit